MKYFLIAASLLALAAGAAGAGFEDVKTVYVLPMSNGMDQYLAIRLTTGATMQVVTDPQKADAVLTDHLGQSFEEKLDEYYTPKPKAEDSVENTQTFSRVGSGMHPRGAAFLVNRKTREVIWSTYARPKNSTPEGLRQAADKIGADLEKAIRGK